MVAFQIPLVYLAIAPFLNDGTTLLRSAILSLFPICLYFLNPIKFERKFLISSFVMLLPIWYLISWAITRNQSLTDFLLGGYGRGTGFLPLVGILLTYLYIAYNAEENFDKLFKYAYLTVILALTHGFLQVVNLDPISWANNSTNLYLTVGNTNFASAILGMLSIFLIVHFFVVRTRYKIVIAILISINLLLIFKTKSSQGFLIFIFNIILVTWFMFRARNKIISKKIQRSVVILTITLIILTLTYFIGSSENLIRILMSLRTDLQLNSRLAYWRIGYEVGKDNIIFGVGKDRLFYYSPEYLNKFFPGQVRELTSIDKAHNIIIDHFANGGLIAALIWICFCLIIFKSLFGLLSAGNLDIKKWKLLPFISMWITYFFQSIISPDDLFLTLLGITSAGIIYGLNRENNYQRILN